MDISIAVDDDSQTALVIHRQRRPGQPRTPHRHYRLRLRRFRSLRHHRLFTHTRHVHSQIRTGDATVARGQYFADARASNDPLVPIPLGHSQLGLDPIGLLPQFVHTTASGVLALFQQSHDRRHP
ncbi:hypothetical protein JT723_21375 [Streptomyces bryophytorum]|nr:hypothetical protein [Actinacidiphila bryophytorum]MBN6543480.1 hypothetical protein [Actinacidiphila bryophytorum]